MKALSVRRHLHAQAACDPPFATEDLDTEIGNIFRDFKKKPASVVLDVDGTIIKFLQGTRPHRARTFRPHLETFLSTLSSQADFFLFSSNWVSRTQNIWTRHFQGTIAAFFDRRHLRRGKKDFSRFASPEHPILLVDDTPASVHPWSAHLHVPIARWEGQADDTALLEALQTCQARLADK